MKKLVFVLSVLSVLIFFNNPVLKYSFANNNDTKINFKNKTTNTNYLSNINVINPENKNILNYLTKDDALNLLLDMNSNLVYSYQGDENTFNFLKLKKVSGYVFLPNATTDLGYFVDKKTSNIYYFHPSGYLEKIK